MKQDGRLYLNVIHVYQLLFYFKVKKREFEKQCAVF